jgi:hypothetical protein
LHNSIPNNEIKMKIGNLHAKLGWGDIYKWVTGKHSLHLDTNNNEHRVTDFAISRIIIASACFPHKYTHKVTVASSDGNTLNQIDHVLTETWREINTWDVSSYRGANCDSDHYLLWIKYRSQNARRINKNNTSRETHFKQTEKGITTKVCRNLQS